mgnify:CR=1 FL=1
MLKSTRRWMRWGRLHRAASRFSTRFTPAFSTRQLSDPTLGTRCSARVATRAPTASATPSLAPPSSMAMARSGAARRRLPLDRHVVPAVLISKRGLGLPLLHGQGDDRTKQQQLGPVRHGRKRQVQVHVHRARHVRAQRRLDQEHDDRVDRLLRLRLDHERRRAVGLLPPVVDEGQVPGQPSLPQGLPAAAHRQRRIRSGWRRHTRRFVMRSMMRSLSRRAPLMPSQEATLDGEMTECIGSH